jgi:hypothetical protein
MERDALGAGGGEELDGNDGEAEGDVEILERASHGFCRSEAFRVVMWVHYIAARGAVVGP